jgi:hypothetical protein
VIEKVVFAALVARGITFYFGAYWGDMPFTAMVEHYRPDFILPEYKIVIEAFGYYWHTLEGSYEEDARRAAMFLAAGYKLYVLWDYEVYADPFECLDKIPELINPPIKTGRVFIADRPFDPTASLAAQRRKYPKIVRTRQKLSLKGLIGSGYRPWLRPSPPVRRRATERHPAFMGISAFDAEYLETLRVYSQKWRDYITSLGEYYKTYPQGRKAYPEEYKYWATWVGWWNRWERLSDVDWIAYMQQLEDFFKTFPDSRDVYEAQYQLWLSWKRAGTRPAW